MSESKTRVYKYKTIWTRVYEYQTNDNKQRLVVELDEEGNARIHSHNGLDGCTVEVKREAVFAILRGVLENMPVVDNSETSTEDQQFHKERAVSALRRHIIQTQPTVTPFELK